MVSAAGVSRAPSARGLKHRDPPRDVTIQMLFADASGGLGVRREPPEEGLMCELLWSDPQAPAGRSPSKRGVGVAFGPDVTRRFLEDNKLQLLVRSHEARSIVGGLRLGLCLGLHLGSLVRHLGGKSRGASGRVMACGRLCTRRAVLLRAWCELWAGQEHCSWAVHHVPLLGGHWLAAARAQP